jgi:tetratricopeptide (TPR) repeat protein
LNPKKLRYQDLVLHLSGQTLPGVPEVSEAGAPFLAQGEERLRHGKAEEAVASFRKALRSQKDHPVLLLYESVALLQLGRQREVEESVRKILELRPGEMLEAIALAILAEVLRSQGRLAEGTRLCEDLLDAAETSFAKTIAYYELAWNYAEVEGTLEHGLEAARRSLELAPDELKAFPLAVLGWIYFKRGELDQSVELLSRSSQIGPSATTLTHLGMALLADGQESQAREALSRARELGGFAGGLEEALVGCLRDRTRLLTRSRGAHVSRAATEARDTNPARPGAREGGQER